MTWTKIILGLALGATLVGGMGSYWVYGNRMPGLRLHGTVEIQEVRLSSKLGGRVRAVRVREGDLVQPGQRLVELEAPELEAVRLQLLARLQAAAAQRDRALSGPRLEEKRVARAAMDAAEARWRKLAKGFRPEEIEQARFELAMAQAESDRAQETYKRESATLGRGSSKADYDSALAALLRGQAHVNSARARWQMLSTGYRPEEIAEARAEWERARANWDLLEAGTRSEEITEAEARVGELEAKLKEVEAQLAEAVVVAPERAVLEVLAVRPGDVVAPNHPVARVLRADDLWIKAFVPEIELGKVRLHQQVEVTCDSYPGKRFEGEVTHIASASEFTPRNVQSYDERRHQVFALRIRVADPQGVFKSGMAAEVWLPLE